MNFLDLRLKFRHWFRKYKNIVFIVVVVWGIIFLINKYLGSYVPNKVPSTTSQPTVSVINDKEAPSKLTKYVEETIEEYVGYCNDEKYDSAFAMLSDDCKKYAFDNNIERFIDFILVKIPGKRKYSIQNYSDYGKYFIYEVKYTEDILATGLTNQKYMYSSEKIVFTPNKDGGYDMATGNFVKHDIINNVAENEYVKVDVKERDVYYSLEIYDVKFTNRTDSTVVIQDNIENDEINLVLSGEYRPLKNPENTIILGPNEQQEAKVMFTKFADDGEDSEGILFSNIRVIEDYKGVNGTAEERKAEIDNALAKFSMQIPVKVK